jgi:hypothetical protein
MSLFFGVIENLFDRDPPPTPNGGTSFDSHLSTICWVTGYRMGLRAMVTPIQADAVASPPARWKSNDRT